MAHAVPNNVNPNNFDMPGRRWTRDENTVRDAAYTTLTDAERLQPDPDQVAALVERQIRAWFGGRWMRTVGGIKGKLEETARKLEVEQRRRLRLTRRNLAASALAQAQAQAQAHAAAATAATAQDVQQQLNHQLQEELREKQDVIDEQRERIEILELELRNLGAERVREPMYCLHAHTVHVCMHAYRISPWSGVGCGTDTCHATKEQADIGTHCALQDEHRANFAVAVGHIHNQAQVQAQGVIQAQQLFEQWGVVMPGLLQNAPVQPAGAALPAAPN